MITLIRATPNLEYDNNKNNDDSDSIISDLGSRLQLPGSGRRRGSKLSTISDHSEVIDLGCLNDGSSDGEDWFENEQLVLRTC